MKYLKKLIVLAVLCQMLTPKADAQSVKLTSDIDSVNFFLGYFFGKQLKPEIDYFGRHYGIDVNVEVLLHGVGAAIAQTLNISERELSLFLDQYFSRLEAKIYADVLKEGQDFLAENAKKQEIVTLPSGLQYKTIREGTGRKPEMNDVVDLVYHGTLINGMVFDSSKERGDTVSFTPNGVIQGFAEALCLMNEGSIWEIYIPSELGYGENVNPSGPIRPNSVLIFEIDLVRVRTQEE